jgi:hypothetical protein
MPWNPRGALDDTIAIARVKSAPDRNRTQTLVCPLVLADPFEHSAPRYELT